MAAAARVSGSAAVLLLPDMSRFGGPHRGADGALIPPTRTPPEAEIVRYRRSHGP